MKAFSLWQPWASLWLSDRKIHETRHWSTTYRGWLLVHAAKRLEVEVGENLRDILEDEYGGHWAMDLPRGAIIGRVELLDVIPTERFPDTHWSTDDYHCGDFSPGRYAWKRGAFEAFKAPIPYRGQQTLFEVPAEISAGGFTILPKPAAPQGVLGL